MNSIINSISVGKKLIEFEVVSDSFKPGQAKRLPGSGAEGRSFEVLMGERLFVAKRWGRHSFLSALSLRVWDIRSSTEQTRIARGGQECSPLAIRSRQECLLHQFIRAVRRN